MSNILGRVWLRPKVLLSGNKASWLTPRCPSPTISLQHKSFQSFRAGSTASFTALDKKPGFITTPIFYVNAEPHVGHLYTLVLADVYKRWETLNGRSARLLTGTDEHGMKVQQAAAKVGVPAELFCDDLAAVFKKLANEVGVDYDRFIRTTDKDHMDAVQFFWKRLQDEGFIYQSKHTGWYSIADETFYTEPQIHEVVNPATGLKEMVSKETGRLVEYTSEMNYHFAMSKLQPKLMDFYKANPNFITPYFRYKEIIDEVAQGLDDLSISRPVTRLTWGIPVPEDNSQTVYVWVDALINYLTAAGYPFHPGKDHALGWPADLHVVGKDIIRFHGIYWPALLLALDLPLPKQILTHGHWTMNRRKMSKSDGNVVNPFFAIKRFGLDTIRFYMAMDGGVDYDADYSNEMIATKYKTFLQNQLGNLVGRISFKGFDIRRAIKNGKTEAFDKSDTEKVLLELLEKTPEFVTREFDNRNISGALKKIFELISVTHQYLTIIQPWSLFKTDTKEAQESVDHCIWVSSETTRMAGILLQPFMPSKALEILDHLKVAEERRSFEWAVFGKDRTYANGIKDRVKLFPPIMTEDY